MEKKSVVPVWVSVVLVALLAVGILANIVDMTLYSHLEPFSIAVETMNTAACVAALVYCLKGYCKDAALFFNGFCIIYCASCLLPLYLIAKSYQGGSLSSILTFTVHLLPFACMAIFVVAKDLGKAKSLALAGIILLCTFITFLLALGLPFYFLISIFVNLIITIVFFIMVYAKYQDKAARGSK